MEQIMTAWQRISSLFLILIICLAELVSYFGALIGMLGEEFIIRVKKLFQTNLAFRFLKNFIFFAIFALLFDILQIIFKIIDFLNLARRKFNLLQNWVNEIISHWNMLLDFFLVFLFTVFKLLLELIDVLRLWINNILQTLFLLRGSISSKFLFLNFIF